MSHQDITDEYTYGNPDDYFEYDSDEDGNNHIIDKLYNLYNTIEKCISCSKNNIANWTLAESIFEGERQMGADYSLCYDGYFMCDCGEEFIEEDSESIYIDFNGNPLEQSSNNRLFTIEYGYSFEQGNIRNITLLDQQKGDSIVIELDVALVIYDSGYQKYLNGLLLFIKSRLVKDSIRIQKDIELTKKLIRLEMDQNKIKLEEPIENEDNSKKVKLDKENKEFENTSIPVIIVISHKDQDHSGGLNKLIDWLCSEGVKFHIILDFPYKFEQRENQIIINMEKVRINEKPFQISFGDTVLNFHLSDEKETCSNRRSIVVAITFNTQKLVVLTGDQYYDKIKNIIDNHYPNHILELFQVPHHGSIHNGHTKNFPISNIYFISGYPTNIPKKIIDYQKQLIKFIIEVSPNSRIFFNQLKLTNLDISNVMDVKQTNIFKYVNKKASESEHSSQE